MAQRSFAMATMNISLPQQMKDWVEAQTADGRYANASDFVRDMIRREQIKAEKIAVLHRLAQEGIDSGFTTVTRDGLLAEIKAKLGIADEIQAEQTSES
jgi:antitoxin ParD1/3/4